MVALAFVFTERHRLARVEGAALPPRDAIPEAE
jgi:hypothetical protein